MSFLLKKSLYEWPHGFLCASCHHKAAIQFDDLFVVLVSADLSVRFLVLNRNFFGDNCPWRFPAGCKQYVITWLGVWVDELVVTRVEQTCCPVWWLGLSGSKQVTIYKDYYAFTILCCLVAVHEERNVKWLMRDVNSAVWFSNILPSSLSKLTSQVRVIHCVY